MFAQIKALLLEEYSVSQWVLLFFFYSFCGYCWEVFLYIVKERRFVNRGFLFGPILPIYGFGAVSILLDLRAGGKQRRAALRWSER